MRRVGTGLAYESADFLTKAAAEIEEFLAVFGS